jgi:quinol-cytochrome oxidoreductase complex cytochrome b subunit
MRYIILILLNIPIILLALVNFITRYKLKRIEKIRLRRQVIIWLIILIILIGSFPVYNILSNKPLLDSSELSLFDIFQTTAIIFLFYIVNNQRQKIDQTERRVQDLHQALSIKLADYTHAED